MSEAPRCVYCRQRAATPEHRPFCSERCRMADLGRWLSGDYRVAGPDRPADEDRVNPESDSDSQTTPWPKR